MTKPIVELDFDRIKEELIDFIKSNPTFTDYNFEGSALNTLVDLLAFNTHYNAFYANMVHNESFLDTAQKRSSVVSKAKELGYTPGSVVSSTAYINIALDGVPANSAPFYLLKGAKFDGSNDNGQYTFLASKDYIVSIDGTEYSFDNIELKEGVLIENSFLVDSTQNPRNIYTIPNKDIDISTLRIYVRENITSTERLEFFVQSESYDLLGDSRSFFIQESYDGFFQFYFGDNVIGREPINGNVIDIDYIVSTAKELANGCTSFGTDSTFGSAQNSTVSVVQNSLGGKDRESIDSIKSNAKRAFTSRNRAVTSLDYENTLKDKFQFIRSVSSWGGQDNNPPIYGKVFVSIQPEDGFVLTESVKSSVILPELRKLNVLTVTPELVDPEYTFISITANVKFNKNKTVNSSAVTETLTRQAISDYFNTEANRFGRDYIESNLTNTIKAIDPGISSISIDTFVHAELLPTLGISGNYKVKFNNNLLKGSVISSRFKLNSSTGALVDVYIKDDPDTNIEKIDNLGTVRRYSNVNIYLVSDNSYVSTIGLVEYENSINPLFSGLIDITFTANGFVDNADPAIYLYASTVDPDVLASRNQIIALDSNTQNFTTGVKRGVSIITTPYEKQ